MEEADIWNAVWVIFTSAVKIIGFISFKMLSVMFAVNICNWYKNTFPDKFKKNKKVHGGVATTQEKAVADESEKGNGDSDSEEDNGGGAMSMPKKAISCIHNRLKHHASMEVPEKMEQFKEEDFIQMAEAAINKISERKTQRDLEFATLKAALEEKIKKINKEKSL